MPDQEDLSQKYIQRLEELARIVSVKEGNVCYEYNIPLAECQSHAQILEWVHHLCEKTWMTPEILEKFIEVACDATGLHLSM